MSDLNIDDFYSDAAKVLERLYRSFPRPQVIYVSDISGHDIPDEYGVHSDRHMACFSTFLWLASEGYIRYADCIHQDAVDQAVLTANCFNLLSIPVVETTTQNIQGLAASVKSEMFRNINRLRRALNERSSIEIRSIMAELMTTMAEN